MPTLPLPNLDDRRWEDLVDEGRSLIPFYAPEWTDHNVHDPGISLLELFAWVTEQDLYTVNRVTDAHRRKLLALAGGVAPDPPRQLPAGLQVEGRDPFGVVVSFRTLHALTVQPGRIAVVLAAHQAALEDLTPAWRRGEPVQPFGADPRPGDAFHLGFELQAPWPAGTVLALGFAPGDGAVRERITREAAGRAEDCVPPWEPCGTPAAGDPATGDLAHHSVRLLWEVMTGPGRWTRLTSGAGLDDDTRALTLDGRVVAELPEAVAPGALAGHPGQLAWLRVRLVRGAYDAAPVLRGIALNATEAVQAVPAVVRLRIAPGAPVTGTPPAPGEATSLDVQVDRHGDVTRLAFAPPAADRPAVRVLALDLPGRWLTIEAAAVARGSGEPGQRIQVAHAPVDARSLRLASLEGGSWRDWTVRADFDASGRADAHFLLDPTSGTVTLGDGERGRAAAPGSTLLVTADLTRAGDGNLPAGAVDRLADSPHNRAAVGDLDQLATELTSIANVVPAVGGSAAHAGGDARRLRDARLRDPRRPSGTGRGARELPSRVPVPDRTRRRDGPGPALPAGRPAGAQPRPAPGRGGLPRPAAHDRHAGGGRRTRLRHGHRPRHGPGLPRRAPRRAGRNRARRARPLLPSAHRRPGRDGLALRQGRLPLGGAAGHRRSPRRRQRPGAGAGRRPRRGDLRRPLPRLDRAGRGRVARGRRAMNAPKVNRLVPVEPKRLRHGSGEALLRRDFAEQAAQDDQLRWWHSRALHRAYGVVEGLGVTVTLVGGVRTAEVQPGLAYDCYGRELLLDRPRQVPVPEDDDQLVLAIASIAPDPGCAPPPGGWCRDERVVAGGVVLRWVVRSAFTLRDGVPLTTSDEAAAFPAPKARPIARPRIGHGATIAGETAWRPWVERFEDEQVFRLGIQVDVDTSAAGFTAVPCYFAQLTGSLWSARVPLVLLLPFGHVAQAAKDRFTFRLLAPWLYFVRRLGPRPEPEPEPPVLIEEAPAGEPGLLDAHEREVPLERPLRRPREPDFGQAFRALARVTDLAVSWTGIQQRSDTDGGTDGLP